MPEHPGRPPLAQRDRDVLRDVIRSYILTGEPVSSRSVAKMEHLAVSAATIRNVMADLEDLGYLAQPHTSAGRVPTAAGYHLFIESLMQNQALDSEDRRFIDESLRSGAGAEELVASASHVLSRLSGQAALVVIPALGDTVLKAVEFVPLGGRRVLCVVVSANGFVDNKPIELEETLSREDLVRIGNYLTENFAGLTLSEVRDRLLALMAQERAQVDRLMSLAIQMGRQGLQASSQPGVVVDGAAALLAMPELADIDRVRRLLDAFEDKARLVLMLSRCVEGRGVRVFIGEDSELTSELGFSLVATSYAAGERTLGSLGIFGPSRMEYHRIIPLVHYLAERLGRGLEPVEGS
jgi:heat-inducible transcriptional repressor